MFKIKSPLVLFSITILVILTLIGSEERSRCLWNVIPDFITLNLPAWIAGFFLAKFFPGIQPERA
jgi:hypothetical protein